MRFKGFVEIEVQSFAIATWPDMAHFSLQSGSNTIEFQKKEASTKENPIKQDALLVHTVVTNLSNSGDER